MKIAILTFIKTTNYGAILQAYALQKTLKEFGYNSDILCYINETILNKENSIKKTNNLKSILRNVLIGNKTKSKAIKFKQFENKYMSFSSKDSLKTLEKKYDKIIVGSDQVWNMDITNNDWHYFLDFIDDDNKKIAYAPSFGNKAFDKKNNSKAAEYLKKIKYISVREESGKNIIKSMIGIDVPVVLDPTLLLNDEQWEQDFSFKPPIKNYILVYFPNNKKKVFSFAKKLSKITNFPIVYLSISPRIELGVKTIYDAAPDEFLGWIKNASIVITGSFHGTAFSLNFKKQFYFEDSGPGSRIDNLVRLTGTYDRSIDNYTDVNNKINYNIVEQKMEKIRKKSKDWLISSLK